MILTLILYGTTCYIDNIDRVPFYCTIIEKNTEKYLYNAFI